VRFFGIDTGFFSREQEIVVSQALSDCGFNRATNFHVFREFGGERAREARGTSSPLAAHAATRRRATGGLSRRAHAVVG
jgi:hypothetical protein